MKKTISIQISGILFHIDDDAYATLDAYLKSIHSHFKRTADGDEVVSDIESRIAEQFSEKLKKSKQVITLHDVNALIKTMGTIEDFETFEHEEEPINKKHTKQGFSWENQPFAGKGRLYRDADDQILGGVCAGIAKYFGIDPVITRLAFGLSLFLGGFGALLYILLWIILPEARTTAEKVEMTGGKVTLSALQERIDAAIPKERRDTIFRKVIAVPMMIIRSILQFIGKILRVIVPFVLRVIGFFIMMGSAFAIAGITLVLLTFLINPTSPYIGFPLREAVGPVSYVLLGVSGYFLIFIPIVFALMLGVTMLLMRRTMTAPGVIALTVLWFVALPIFGATLTSKGPDLEAALDRHREQHGTFTEQSFDLTNFDRIEVGGMTNLEVHYGTTYSVVLEATPKDLERLDVSVEEETLSLSRKSSHDSCIFFCDRYDHTLKVTMPELALLDLSGIASASVEGFPRMEALKLIADGHSTIEANVIVDLLSIESDGVSSMVLSGTGQTVNVDLNGVVRIDGSAFVVQDAAIDVSGPSRIILDVRNALTGTVYGPADVRYLTEPKTVTIEEHGPASIRQRDEDEYEYQDW